MLYYRPHAVEEGSLLADYGYVGLLLVVAIIFPIIAVILSLILGLFRLRPRNPNPVKSATYESGMVTIGSAWAQTNFRYYFFALLFVIFDIETVFLYPWAVAFKKLGWFAFIEMIIFLFILVVGLAYAWKKQALEWK
ncbi:MAG: NADH-quinone oxidoreductase subunit A [Chloroflexota bacterium]|nr:NADH-quinone oxidoreductase subunit A [Chloroflexota bacterium]